MKKIVHHSTDPLDFTIEEFGDLIAHLEDPEEVYSEDFVCEKMRDSWRLGIATGLLLSVPLFLLASLLIAVPGIVIPTAIILVGGLLFYTLLK